MKLSYKSRIYKSPEGAEMNWTSKNKDTHCLNVEEKIFLILNDEQIVFQSQIMCPCFFNV